MDLPIYRAKKIDSDEYVEGYYAYCDYFKNDKHTINNSKGAYSAIDPATLAIHFSDMLDSQGNKIFASLSEDGKCGDILQDRYGTQIIKFCQVEYILKMQPKTFNGWYKIQSEIKYFLNNSKVIGIQK